MRIRLLVVFLALVIIPIIVLGVFGVKTMRDQREIVRHRLHSLVQQKLVNVDSQVADIVKRYESTVFRLNDVSDYSEANLRRVIRNTPEINHILLMDQNGKRIFPGRYLASSDEQIFVKRLSQLLLIQDKKDRDKTVSRITTTFNIGNSQLDVQIQRRRRPSYLYPNSPNDKSTSQSQLFASQAAPSPKPIARIMQHSLRQSMQHKGENNSDTDRKTKESKNESNKGWSIWFWDNGLNLIYWYKTKEGYLMAVEVPRTKLLADIIARLPSTQKFINRKLKKKYKVSENDSLITLTDTKGATMYQWGHFSPPAQSKPQASINMSWPLNAWRLNYFSKQLELDPSISYLPLIFGMSTVFLAIIGLAYYFYRENNRELNTARQRVTFVNQVSHELKTPLTNIRMYAELLENDVDEDDTPVKNRVNIIVNESQRLSRLISNVLNFARTQKNSLKLMRAENRVDEIIRSVLDQFGPSLTRNEFTIEFNGNAPDPVYVDKDLLEQILHNLISNVEKYASSGKYLGITSEIHDNLVKITVRDNGPGIPRNKSEKIFETFYRIDDKLTQGVSGTGIGLSISRDLAQLHGGTLEYQNTRKGAVFVITLNVDKTSTHQEQE